MLILYSNESVSTFNLPVPEEVQISTTIQQWEGSRLSTSKISRTKLLLFEVSNFINRLNSSKLVNMYELLSILTYSIVLT